MANLVGSMFTSEFCWADSPPACIPALIDFTMSDALDESYAPITNAQGQKTSFIPLPLKGAPPFGCEQYFREYEGELVGWDQDYGRLIDSKVDCFPDAVTSFRESLELGIPVSLGPIRCPDRWTTGWESTTDKTIVNRACCPPGYSFSGTTIDNTDRNCETKLPKGFVLTYATWKSPWSTHNVPGSTTTMNSDAVMKGMCLYGRSILRNVPEVTEDGEETSILAPSSSSAQPTTTAAPGDSAPITSPIPGPSSVQAEATSTSPISLSSGSTTWIGVPSPSSSAKEELESSTQIGIGVGAGVAAILIITLGVIIFRLLWNRATLRAAAQRQFELATITSGTVVSTSLSSNEARRIVSPRDLPRDGAKPEWQSW